MRGTTPPRSGPARHTGWLLVGLAAHTPIYLVSFAALGLGGVALLASRPSVLARRRH